MNRNKLKCTLIPVILFMVFSIIQSLSLIFKGDDFIWYYINEMEILSDWRNPNGRYFTNTITYLMTRSDLLRVIFYVVFLTALLYLIYKLLDYNQKSPKIGVSLVMLMLLFAPSELYSTVINWVSGFTNYVISLVFTFSYILFCYRIFEKNEKPGNIWSIFTFLTGMAGALCVEHITIYNILLGIFILLFTFFRYRKLYVAHISYFAGAVAGTVCMLMNPQYGVIMSESGDSISPRYFEVSFSGILSQIYNHVIPYYVNTFSVLNVVIFIALLLLYVKKDFSSSDDKTKKYSGLCIGICAAFSAYSFFTGFFADFAVFNLAMRARALQTAFLFLYIVSLIYLSKVLLKSSGMIRAILYIVSSVITAAPFIVANPVTHRCFFASYCFMLLTAGEFIFAVSEEYRFVNSDKFAKVFAFFAAASACCMCIISISNKYCDNLRMRYIKEQITEGQVVVEVITLPYPDYAYDAFLKFDANAEGYGVFNYEQLFMKYNEINTEPEEFVFSYIDMLDYNTAHQS